MKSSNKSKTAACAIVSATAALFLCSCELETSDNGNLDGFWHLERIDTLSTGGSCDTSSDLLFWSVQMRLLNVSDKNNVHTNLNMRFEHANGTLRVYDACRDDRMDGDPALDDAALLRPYGINSLDETFAVEQLTGSRMQLKGTALRLTFRKF